MKRFLHFIHLLLVSVGFTNLAYAQPPNDACGAAIPLVVGVGSCNSILYTNVAATSTGDPAAPACWSPASLSHTVWFSFVATSTDAEITTNFAGSLADTQLAIYSGACGALTLIGCEENINTANGNLDANVTLHGLTVGNTYYLLVDGNGATTGTFGICIQETLPLGPPLPTQDCTGAQTLCGFSNISVPNGPGNAGFTIETPSCFISDPELSSNWYTFTAASNGTVEFTITPNTVIDYDFAVFNVTNSCPGTELVCNWSDVFDTEETGLGCGDIFQCEPALNVIAGQTYMILIDRYTDNSASGFTMTFGGTAGFTSPNPTFTATTVCQGTPTQFTNTTNGNFTYSWNFGDGFTSSIENPTHIFAASGPHSVTLLLTAVPGGCQNAATQTVTVNPRTTTPTINTTAPTCAANGFTTITNYSAANTYTFSPAGPTVGAGGTINGAVIGTSYTIKATIGTCTSPASAAFTNLIRLTAPVVPAINTTAPTCAANGFTTITNYSAANTYTFSPVGPTVGAGGVITGAVIGTPYTVTATIGTCTSPASAAFTNLIRLTTPAVPAISTTAPTCAANGFATITNYNAANTYTFSPVGPTAGAGGIITGTVIGTSYTVTATIGICTSPASAAFTNLIRLTNPAVPAVSTTAPTCAANGFTTITNYSAANTYTFSPVGPTVGAGGVITGAVIGTPYTVTATIGTCTSPASAAFTNLIRLTTPAVPAISTTAPTCATNGFTIITNYSAANTYTFSPVGPTAGAGGIITGAVIGTPYTVTATIGICTSPASAVFTNLIRLTTPAVPAISTTAPTCLADGFTTITNYDPTANYTFTPSGPNAGAGGVITGAIIGTAYTMTATKNGCTSAVSVPFTNSIKLITPVVPILSTRPPTCSNDGFTTIFNYNPAHTYVFSPSGPTAGSGGSITGAVVGTAYTVTDTNGVCTSVASTPFTNAPLLFNVNTTSPQPLHYCDPNNDGFGTFDLTQVITPIIGGNPFIVTFHETSIDAVLGATPIPTPGSYDNINVNTQTVYIRVESNVTVCYAVIPLQLIVDPTPELIEPGDYHACDFDGDGSANFDLTSVTSVILGTTNTATYTISYHISFGDAQSDLSPIPTISHTNFPSSGLTIWIRVEDTATGCFDIVSMELIVDPSPLATQPNYPAYSLCDVTLPLAYEEFDLGSKIDDILLHQNGMNVTFHFSQADAIADNNPLPLLYTNAVPFVQTIWIRIENANTHCFVLSTMDIRVEPLPTPIPPNEVYSICDTNQDGFGAFNLNNLTNDILQGANYTISYHETYDDAQFGNNPLVSPYDNVTPFVQFIYVLAVDNVTGCKSVIPIELNVKPQPITPFTVPDLVQCDEDANPQNGSMFFDLTQNNPAVLAIQTSAPTNYTVTYHVSQSDAIAGVPEIIQSANYVGTNHEIIWVRVENNATECFSIGSFELLINAPLALPIPMPLSICDADAVPNNQYTEFDLTVKNNEITGGQLNMDVTYYPDYPVTASSIAIPNPTAYTNILPAVQTLGVMVTTLHGCRSYTSLDIRVLPIPVPNIAGIQPLAPQCDINNTGDMMEIFDLTVNASNIINSDPAVTLHYFPSQADALAETNEILNPTAALVGQNVWIRLENNQVDYLGNNCFVLVEQPLTVNPLPATIPNTIVQNCDDDTDGQTAFDLTITTTAFYGNANLTITYHTTANDAQFGTNPIANPSTYLNVANPQVIYIRVVNNATGCVNYNGQFTIIVNPKPTATAPANFDTCDTDGTNDGFFALDLSTYINGVIGTQTGVTTTFYNTQSDAINAINSISDLVNYQTYTHTIWIRVENDTTGCYQLVSFNNTVEELAEPNITSPSDTICVEFGTNTVLSGLTLDSGITNPNYTFEWFEAANPAIVLGTNPTYTINTAAPGDYTVVATSTSPLGCVSNPSNTFTVIQSGPAQFAVPPYTVSNAFDDNQVITIDVVGFGLYEYSLDNGPFQSSNVFEHVLLGEHTITVRDVRGNTSCGEVSLDEVQTINYPHYFTPNGDGFNDTWNVVGLQNQLGTKLHIFDRFGKLLKQISTNGEGWDGTFNGHLLPATDYWFKIEYLEQSMVKEFKAHFSLKR